MLELRVKPRLLPETMTDDLIGLRVTSGLLDTSHPTQQGTITGYDEKKIHIRFSETGKAKKLDYNDDDLVLCNFQFDAGIEFVLRLPEE